MTINGEKMTSGRKTITVTDVMTRYCIFRSKDKIKSREPAQPTPHKVTVHPELLQFLAVMQLKYQIIINH